MKFVKQFKTPNQKYVFDVPTSKFLTVDDETFSFLWENGADVINEAEDLPPGCRELLRQGYLSGRSPVATVSHPYNGVLDVLLRRRLSQMTLQLTQQCNFRCSYCIYSEDHNLRQRSHSNRRMDFSTAKGAVDFLWEHSVDSSRVNIGLYGGEPLLEFGLVQRIVEYGRERFEGKEISFSMTTNGSLLREEVVDFLAENEVRLMISLDGPEAIHNQNRRFADGSGTYDTVMEKLRYIKEHYPDYWKQIQYSMVIDPRNDFDEINAICKDDSVCQENIMATIVDMEYDNFTVKASEQYYEEYEYQLFLAYLAH